MKNNSLKMKVVIFPPPGNQETQDHPEGEGGLKNST